MMRNLNSNNYDSQCCGTQITRSFPHSLLDMKVTERPKVLFFFMERFSNSRSWQSAKKLASLNKWFDENNVIVILVGDFKHLLPATRMAAEMDLPFLLLADHDDALWHRYGKPTFESCQRKDSYILVDLCGQVQSSVQDKQLGLMMETDQLFSTLNTVH